MFRVIGRFCARVQNGKTRAIKLYHFSPTGNFINCDTFQLIETIHIEKIMKKEFFISRKGFLRYFFQIWCLIGICFAQNAAGPDDLSVTTRVYSQNNDPISKLSNPIEDSDSSKITSDSKYIRMVIAFGNKLDAVTREPLILNSISDHSELRSFDTSRIAIWTHLKLTDPSVLPMLKGMESFLNEVMAGVNPDFNLESIYLPLATRQLEIELYSLSISEMSRSPICKFNNTQTKSDIGQNLPKCPSLILTDELMVGSLFSDGAIRQFGPLMSTFGFNPTVNLLNSDKSMFRIQNQWFGLPLFDETRVLVYNATTLESLNLKLPPPAANWGPNNEQWTWEEMVNYARLIKESGKGEGFRFQGNLKEEMILTSMIAASMDGQILTENNKCAMKSSDFQNSLEATVGQLWGSDDPIATKDFVPQDQAFQDWKDSTEENPLDINSNFCCQNGKPWGVGLGIASPSRVKFGIDSEGNPVTNSSDSEVKVGLVPGKSYLGGTAFSLTSSSLNPSASFAVVRYILDPQREILNDINLAVNAPPPYINLQNAAPWNDPKWDVYKTQLVDSIPFDDKSGGELSRFFPGFLNEVPFRLMIMDIAFKGMSISRAADRACQIIDTLALPKCVSKTVNIDVNQCGSSNIIIPPSKSALDDCRLDLSQLESVSELILCPFLPSNSPLGITIYVLNGVALLSCLILTIFSQTYLYSFGATMLFIAGLLAVGAQNSLTVIFFVLLIVLGFVILFAGSSILDILQKSIISPKNQSVEIIGFGPREIYEEERTSLRQYFYGAFFAFVLFNIGLFIGWTFVPSAEKISTETTAVVDLDSNVINLNMPNLNFSNEVFLYTLAGFSGVLILLSLIKGTKFLLSGRIGLPIMLANIIGLLGIITVLVTSNLIGSGNTSLIVFLIVLWFVTISGFLLVSVPEILFKRNEARIPSRSSSNLYENRIPERDNRAQLKSVNPQVTFSKYFGEENQSMSSQEGPNGSLVDLSDSKSRLTESQGNAMVSIHLPTTGRSDSIYSRNNDYRDSKSLSMYSKDFEEYNNAELGSLPQSQRTASTITQFLKSFALERPPSMAPIRWKMSESNTDSQGIQSSSLKRLRESAISRYSPLGDYEDAPPFEVQNNRKTSNREFFLMNQLPKNQNNHSDQNSNDEIFEAY